MISTQVGFELPLFGTYDNKSKTKEINFDLKYILNYNIYVRKLALVQVPYGNDFFILYQVYMQEEIVCFDLALGPL